MSKTIDEKVVEMRFDNKQFESNVQTSMSTIDKLKQKLNFTGATKGLENINSAANKVNMSGMSTAIETVHAKFSALEVMGVTALANITNSAVNAGKRIISALTVDPIISGFQEYETQMNAVQTILANTQSKGSTLDDVNSALNELNKYADQTIYNFTEMTKNIGTFTAAGVDLEKSVTSIKGIANLAAVSGSTSQQASTAMYQLSQALAAGRVSLMDWNSVVNAGMGGELFQNALKRTATQMGTNVDALIEKYGSFRESLTKGQWLTADVLTETLTQLSGAYTEADLIAQGYTEKQAKEITELAQTAVDAATKVKTFTQLWDTAKEAAQSGWAQTWQILVGDFEQAKEYLTGVSDVINGFITSSSDSRNNILKNALGSNWDALIEKINEAGISTEAFETKLKETAKESGYSIDELIKKHGSLAKAFSSGEISTSVVIKTIKKFAESITGTTKATTDAADKLEYYNTVVRKVIRGDFKNGVARVEELTNAQYDYAIVQKLVNKVWERNGRNWSDCTVTAEELASVIGDMSEAELKNIGYTKEQAEKLKELARQAEETGTPLNELINSLSKPSGREMLLASLSNSIKGIIGVLTVIKTAWANVFPPERLSAAIYNFAEAMYNLTEPMRLFYEGADGSNETADKLRRTFEGLFAILDLVTTLFGGGFKIALKVISSILGAFDISILDVTANVGDAAVALRNFIKENEFIDKAVTVAADAIIAFVDKVKELGSAFMALPEVQKALDWIVKKFGELKDVGTNAISGLQNGLKEGIYSIPGIMIEIGKTILNTIKSVLGIHSPSKEMHSVGVNVGEGLINGLKAILSKIGSAAKSIGTAVVDTISGIIGSIDWSTIVAVAISAGMLLLAKKLVNIIEAISSPLAGIGDILSGVGDVVEEFSDSMKRLSKAFSFKMKAEAIKSLAIAIAILAASIFVLAQVPAGKLFTAIGAIAALAVVIGALAFVVGRFGPEQEQKFGGVALAVLGISTALLIMASAVKKLETINEDRFDQVIKGFLALIVGLGAILVIISKLLSGPGVANVAKVGALAISLSVSLMLMVAAVKLIGTVSADELKAAIPFLVTFSIMIAALTAVSAIAGKGISKIATMAIGLSVALMLMVGVFKLAATLTADELIAGIKMLALVTVFIAALVAISMFSNGIVKVGGALLGVSVALLAMVAVMKLVANMSPGDIAKGLVVVGFLSLFVAGLIAVAGLAGPGSAKLALTLIAMSLSVAILAGIAVNLSLIDLKGMSKGLIAVGILVAFIAILAQSTRGANNIKGTMIAMTVAIAIMAVAIAGLSFIDPTRLAGAVAAMAIVMQMFSVMIKSTANVKSGMAILFALTAAVAVLGGIIFALSMLPVQNVLGVSAGLSVLMLSLAGAMKILGTVGKVAPSAMVALGVMTLVIAGLATILGLIQYFDIRPSIETVVALSTLLLAMAGVTKILTLIGPFAEMAVPAALAMAKVLGIIALIVAAAGGIAQIPGAEWLVNEGGAFLTAIGQAIGGFIGGIAGGVLAGISESFPTIGTNLSNFMTNLKPFLDGVSGITPEMAESIKSLASMILMLTAADLLNGIKSFIGLGDSSLASFAAGLKPFGEGIANFGTAVSGVDFGTVGPAIDAAEKIVKVASELPNSGGLLGDILGNNDMGPFADGLKPFAEGLVSFATDVAGIDFSSVDPAITAAEKIVKVASELPNEGGLLGMILGNNGMADFALGLAPFASGIVGFATDVAGIDFSSVDPAITAAEKIVKVASELPNEGGLLGMILGNNGMANFASGLAPFADGIVYFAKTVSGEGVDFSKVSPAVDAAKKIIEVAAALPNEGGILSWFTGDSDLTNFGSQLSTFGQGISDFYAKIEGVNSYKLSSTATSVQTLANIAMAVEGLDFKSFGNFGDALTDLGESGVDGFIDAFENSDAVATRAINGFVSAFATAVSTNNSSIAHAFDYPITAALNGMHKRGTEFMSAGKALVLYFLIGLSAGAGANNSLSGLVSGILSGIRSYYSEYMNAGLYLASAIGDGANADVKVRSAFLSIMSSAKDIVRNEHSGFKIAGTYLMTALAAGVKLGAMVKIAVLGIATTAKTAVRNEYSEFKSAGSYLVGGFAAGITSETYVAKNAAIYMARSAYLAAKKELDINSPSRVAEALGEFFDLGMAKGIVGMQGKVVDSSTSLADLAIESTKNVLSRIAESVNSDLDAQPTIRPVIDLSNVKTGVGAINSMFDMAPSVATMANLNAISSMNSRNGQNGIADVASAINDLNKKLDSLSTGDTYQLGNITYSEGSEVSEAVKVLVRAMKMEGRV